MRNKDSAYTPKPLGKITIGHREEVNDKLKTMKDDFFTLVPIGSNGPNRINHPMHAKIFDQHAVETPRGKKLRTIPVRLQYRHPDLNMQHSYAMFAISAEKRDLRPVCASTMCGKKAMRRTTEASGAERIDIVECKGPAACTFHKGKCDDYARAYFIIDGQEYPTSPFIFRTRGINSIQALKTKMGELEAFMGDKLPFADLSLNLHMDSSYASHNSPFYFVNLDFRNGKTKLEVLEAATKEQQIMLAAGGDQSAVEELNLHKLYNSEEIIAAEGSEDNDDLLGDGAPGGDPVGGAAGAENGAAAKALVKTAPRGRQAMARVTPDMSEGKKTGLFGLNRNLEQGAEVIDKSTGEVNPTEPAAVAA